MIHHRGRDIDGPGRLRGNLQMGLNAVVISGTGTGVGKTAVACVIGAKLASEGYRVALLKPIESGWKRQKFGDADRLAQVVAMSKPNYLYRLTPALAPADGFALGRGPSMKRIYRFIQRHCLCADWTLVEGAGGLLTPISAKWMMADLFLYLDLPVVIVGTTALGGIHQALSTIEAAHHRGLSVVGLILTEPKSISQRTRESTVRWVKRFSGVPLLGLLPHRAALLEPSPPHSVYRRLGAHLTWSQNLLTVKSI